MEKLEKISTDGRILKLDVSEETCKVFGFLSGDIAVNPNKNEVLIIGVAPGNEGDDVLWYEIKHPSIKGKICYWDGPRNLIDAGFVF